MQSVFTVNRTALVTGASAGIGRELTNALASKLDSLVLVAPEGRTPGAIEERASISLLNAQCCRRGCRPLRSGSS